MTETRPSGRWLRSSGAIGICALLLFSCTGGERSEPGATVADPPPTTTTSSPGPAEADPFATLLGALEAMRAGYSFESTVTLDGERVTTMSGWAGAGGVQATVETGNAEIEYLVTPQGRWTREPEGEWLTLSGESPVADPLASLSAPQSVELVASEEGRLVLSAAYPAAVLGLEGEPMVPVEVLVLEGRVTRLSYAFPAGDRTATVVTSFDEVGASPPVTAPNG